MILKMKVDYKGSEDGLHVQTYKKDQEYEINSDLARVFLELEVAIKVADFPKKKSAKPKENKAMDIPKDKAVDSKDEKDKKDNKDKKDKKDKK